MVKKTLTQMSKTADAIADNYTQLEQQLFYLLIDATKDTRSLLLDADHPLEWRFAMLRKMGGLTQEVVRLVARTAGVTEKQIYALINGEGLTVANQMSQQLATLLKMKTKPISADTALLIKSYARQTFRDIDNNVNQTLLTTNYQQNAATRTYQEIVNKTVLDITTGRKTPQRALTDNILKWHDKGIKTKLIDQGQHQWSLEGYTRTVIDSTTARVFNDARVQTMKDYDSVLCVMTSHPASRPACAPIQGKVVNIVPDSDPRHDPEFDSIYNHGYGEPAGTLGINCGHRLYPYVKGVSHNFQEQYDPHEAVQKMNVQSKQRYYERSIRHKKEQLQLANKLGDEKAQRKLSAGIRGYQKKLRDVVKENDFLTRQYDRERIVTK